MSDERTPQQEAAGALMAWAEHAGRVMAEWIEGFRPVFEAMNRIASDPEVIRAAIRAGYIEPEPPPCHCLCVKLHPDDMGVCDNEAVTTRQFTSSLTGPRDVPLCAPCAVAQGIRELA